MDNQAKIITPKDFFMNLGWVITLYGSVISLLNLLFETINRVFPDVLSGYYYGTGYYSTGIRWAIAWLIVLFPVYIFITRYLQKMFIVESYKKDLWIRKWFVFLTLFLSTATVLVDIVVIINSFLGGELTTRFALKAVATLVVAGMIFAYYFYDLKNTYTKGVGKIATVLSIFIILASLVWAFAVIGSPASERARRFDEQRVQHLQDIQWRITNYWQSKQRLPENITELNDNLSNFLVPIDPKTKASYEYQVKGELVFELCANFDLSNKDTQNTPKDIYQQRPNSNEVWIHDQGRACFERKIDRDLYPPKVYSR